MKQKKTLYLIVFMLSALSTAARQRDGYITVDNIRRHFVCYEPGLSLTNPAVIISLHGRLGTGRQMMGFADFRPLADAESFIIICPDGIGQSWNDGRSTPAQKQGINDVKFISELIDYAVTTRHADASRIYVTGMSNGGFMASRLACELPGKIAAVAVVAASMDQDAGYEPVKPIPIMYIQGTDDPLVPFNGGAMSRGKGYIYSFEAILKQWADMARCSTKPQTSNLPNAVTDGTTVNKREYYNSTTGIKVIGYAINGGGHTWPGGSQYLPKFLIGNVSHNLDACQVIWAFFKNYRLYHPHQ